MLEHAEVEAVLTTAAVLEEVREYVPTLAKKKRLSIDVALLAVAALPVAIVEKVEYARMIPEARRRIGRRDPDDVEILALALSRQLPVWSNDNDFADAGIEWHTTADLLAKLQRSTPPGL